MHNKLPTGLLHPGAVLRARLRWVRGAQQVAGRLRARLQRILSRPHAHLRSLRGRPAKILSKKVNRCRRQMPLTCQPVKISWNICVSKNLNKFVMKLQ